MLLNCRRVGIAAGGSSMATAEQLVHHSGGTIPMLRFIGRLYPDFRRFAPLAPSSCLRLIPSFLSIALLSSLIFPSRLSLISATSFRCSFRLSSFFKARRAVLSFLNA